MNLYRSQSFFMKRFLLHVSSLAGVLILVSGIFYITNLFSEKPKAIVVPKTLLPDRIAKKLNSQAREAKRFVNKHRFNNSVCFLIDMSVEAGKNRFFVYDLSKDSIIDNGLVTHGRCNEIWLVGRKYGNEVGCGCTSVGKYRIGHPYQGRFGLAYKLTGLDSTNNNAFKRYVVLHSHECVPGSEVHPYPICQSDGCPTVSKMFLTRLATTIDESSRPILLWIYD